MFLGTTILFVCLPHVELKICRGIEDGVCFFWLLGMAQDGVASWCPLSWFITRSAMAYGVVYGI